jgi:hypothetical protein
MHHLNFEITNYLQQGENNIEVVAALTILNDNIGRGKAGVKEYKKL